MRELRAVHRAAVIGCGMIGSRFASDAKIKGIYSHAGAYAACARTELVALCDSNEQTLRESAAHWKGAASFTGIGELLATAQPVIVSVCTPDETHAAVLEEVLHAPSVRAVLAEKPLASSVGAAAALVALAASRGIVLAVNYSRRYSQGHERARRIVAAGELGAIQAVAGYYTKGVVHNGSHWFDLVRFIVGEIRTVVAAGSAPAAEADPTIDVRLVLENNAHGYLHGCAAEAFSIFELDVLGTAGRLRFSDSGHRVERFDAADSPHYSGYRALVTRETWDGGLADALPNAVVDLVDALETGRPPRCTGGDGVAALQLALTAAAASRRNDIDVARGG